VLKDALEPKCEIHAKAPLSYMFMS